MIEQITGSELATYFCALFPATIRIEITLTPSMGLSLLSLSATHCQVLQLVHGYYDVGCFGNPLPWINPGILRYPTEIQVVLTE
ncbi:hypothetical protein GQ43DRAFT_443982 [Delitschia confertaspora ATCC 74209]|uniref:Uncharacterized protein n=1 Tax=Delitschia confertaspora ATCC 74209 TaxID=1513339 RepID=A0A9P4JE69_9PLEO|nr:hypothetical protein GQ43DRAFT_443982 [Delitschia confertaspora ATCC 74209]